MEFLRKVKQIAISTALWVFVAFCLIMAIGMPPGASTVLMLLTAILAAPIKPIRKAWDALLGLLPADKKKRRRKKKSSHKSMKALIIALVFIFGFAFGMAAMETPDPTLSTDPGYTTEATTEPSEPTEEPTTEPATEPATEPPTEAPTEPVTEPVTEAPTEAPTEPATEPETEPPTEAPTEPVTEAPTEAPTEPKAPENSTFSIHFIDVGQADAALVECDGHYMLIDGGNKGDSSVVYSVLKKAGASKLDIVVGTHAHEDHIGGIPGAFNYATADMTLCPVKSYDSNAFDDFAKYAKSNGGGITIPSVGDTYTLGSATVKVLGVNGGSDTNDTSIVLRIDYGKTSFLFAGDAEREAEQVILNSGADLSATVLKVGHHGSDTSTTYPFLREVMPQYAVVSVGEGNSYGHPTEDTLSRLRDADVNVFRTDLQGDIYCTSDGETVTFEVSRNKDADVFSGIGSNSTEKEQEQEQEETEAPTAKPTTPKEDKNNEPMVWIPKTGSKYHSNKGCSGMKNPTEVTKSTAIARGYDPCKKCY